MQIQLPTQKQCVIDVLTESAKPLTVDEIATLAGVKAHKVREILVRLEEAGKVSRKYEKSGLHPTVFSLVRRKKTEVTGTSIAQPWCISVMTGHYDGRELRPFDGRPGAMDAYSLPSRGV